MLKALMFQLFAISNSTPRGWANIMNKLADALGTSVDYLISGDKSEKAKSFIKKL
ncbi:MAG: hypothetical protein NVV59_02850 [Chitinophagaceae bacterium]|nr:hypothetical protein [Chitinophagaceae bacterium]